MFRWCSRVGIVFLRTVERSLHARARLSVYVHSVPQLTGEPVVGSCVGVYEWQTNAETRRNILHPDQPHSRVLHFSGESCQCESSDCLLPHPGPPPLHGRFPCEVQGVCGSIAPGKCLTSNISKLLRSMCTSCGSCVRAVQCESVGLAVGLRLGSFPTE